MYTLRLVIALVGTVLVAALAIPLFFIRPFHRNNMADACWLLSNINRFIWNVDYQITNERLLEPDSPTVFIANHQDTQDLFFGPKIVRKGIVALGKWELIFIPFFGQAFYFAGNILVRRHKKEKAQEALHEAAMKIAQHKKSVLIFPEGTRNWGKPLPFKLGAFKLAIDAQVPITPICFASRPQSMTLNKWYGGTVKIKVLEPIETKGMTQEDAIALAVKCRKLVEKEVIEMSNISELKPVTLKNHQN